MSSALASAKRKRAVPEANPIQKPGSVGRAFPPGTNPLSSQQQGQQSQQPSGPIPITQYLALLDKRIRSLESFVSESKSSESVAPPPSLDGLKLNSSSTNEHQSRQQQEIPSNLVEVLDEYNTRFDILAEEIANIKNIVLNLQSYTMEVNKTLMEERIRVLGTETPQYAFNDVTQITLEEALSDEQIIGSDENA
jgi:hypothetical protein